MPSIVNDRSRGTQSTLAIKAPVRVRTTAAISLSGLQIIDGVQLVEYDRVMVANQADNTENGLYVATTSSWQRAPDFDGQGDVVTGTQFKVVEGTVYAGNWYELTTANDVVFGTSAITFSNSGSAASVLPLQQAAEAAAVAAAASRAAAELAETNAETAETNAAASAVAAQLAKTNAETAETNAEAAAAAAEAAAASVQSFPVADTVNIIKGSADPTKIMRFEVDGFTSGQTRTMTPPDANATLAALNVVQTFTTPQRTNETTDNDGSFDLNVANDFKCTPTAGFTLTFTNIPATPIVQHGTIILVNPSAYAVAAHANTKVGASLLALISAAGTYELAYRTSNGVAYVTASGALS